MTLLRKTIFLREVITTDAFGAPSAPLTRVAVIAVFGNPLAAALRQDLSAPFGIGAERGAPAVSCGKAAIVGIAGDMEHGGAVIHPRPGAPLRAAVGSGQAVIPSNVKMGGPGCTIDLPLWHKDNVWSFDHFDTMTPRVADAPPPHEIAMCLAPADGGRPTARCGSGPVTP